MSGIKASTMVPTLRIDNERLILEARSETIESGASYNFTRDAQPVES